MSNADAPTHTHGERIAAQQIPAALTRAPFAYADGATQVFTADGRTSYTENGVPTAGEWSVDDQGRFVSFWPPSYRASYELFFLMEADTVVGVRFVELQRGTTSEGRYTGEVETGERASEGKN